MTPIRVVQDDLASLLAVENEAQFLERLGCLTARNDG
jgi:hypothetical protein